MRLYKKRDDLGSAVIVPDDEVIANEAGNWDLIYTAGEQGLAQGGALRIVIPYGFTPPQTAYACGIGFTTVSSSNPDVKASIHLSDPKRAGGNSSMWGFHLYVEIHEGSLAEGETLTLHYGSQHGGLVNVGSFAQYYEGEAEFTVGVDPDDGRSAPEGGFFLVSDPQPVVRVRSREAHHLNVAIPSISQSGSQVSAKVSARDDEENAVRDFDGTLVLQTPGGEERTGKLGENGQCVFEGLELSSPGIVRVSVRDGGGRVAGESNPCVCTETKPDLNLYWGDIHVMTGFTAGLGTPASAYAYARDICHLDFCAATDGDSGGLASYFSDEEWDATVAAGKEFYEPGQFATLLGFEYHERKVAGDKNVYFREDGAPLLRWCDLEGEQPQAIWDALKGRKALTIPHHTYPTGGRMDPWGYYSPEFQRLVEMYSCWGSSEAVDCPRCSIWGGGPKGTVQAGLEKGYRMGILASGDSHDGHPGNCDWLRLRRGRPSGLVAVRAPELTREAVFDALWDKHCYGTSGKRILLSFTLNSARMGQELSDSGDRSLRTLRIEASGTAPIGAIHVIRNSQTVYTHQGGSADERFEWEDAQPFGEVSLTGYDGKPFIYYYVRVEQEDGELAWSSPIWIS